MNHSIVSNFIQKEIIEKKRPYEETDKSYRIETPFGETKDTGLHLYIFKSNGKYRDFKNGKQGDFTWLVKNFKKLKNMGKEEITSYIIKNYLKVTTNHLIDKIKKIKEGKEYDASVEIFPKRINKPADFYPLSKKTNSTLRFFNYLNNRGIDNSKIKKFKFHYCSSGKYESRVVLPMFYEKKFVYFTARDITGKSNIKYLHPSSSEVEGNGTGSILFNLDSLQENGVAVICEGPFNCFHDVPENNSLLAVNGKVLLLNQFRKLERKKPSKYIIAYDNDKYFHDSTLQTFKFLKENSNIDVEIINWSEYLKQFNSKFKEIEKTKKDICDFGDLYKVVDTLPIYSYSMDKYVREKFLGV